MYGGLAAYLIAEKDGMSGLEAFWVAMACVITLTAVITAIERVFGTEHRPGVDSNPDNT